MKSMKGTRPSSGLLFVDADDTLWEKSICYADATQEIADVSQLRDFSPAQVAAEVDQRDTFGYGEKAFQRARVTTSRDLVGPPSLTDLAHLLQIGQMSRRPLHVLPGVAQTLHSLWSLPVGTSHQRRAR